ncbi:MAG: cardiolipin synthase [Desulforhopalus sp.]
MITYIFEAGVLTALIHSLVVLSVFIRIVMKRPAPGVALAWLLVVTLIPLLGVVLYLLVGERRIGGHRLKMMRKLHKRQPGWIEKILDNEITKVDWDRHLPACRLMDQLGLASGGIPTLSGSDLQLISDTQEILRAIVKDIDGAKSTVHLLFYIWHPGGTADEVVDAVLRARKRGVRCRIIVDAIGSAKWWKSDLRKKLQSAGVEVVLAMPTGLLRMLTSRNDLRLHRKIVVVDGEVAWTGSMNLVDPRFFKQDAGFGEWVDAMARIQGPAIEPLLIVLLSDFKIETGQSIDHLLETSDIKQLKPCGSSDVQVISSGPGEGHADDAILQMILSMIYAAQDEIFITTPYFVPDDSMLRALRGAASRGVRVELIVPAKVDSILVRYASRSYFAELMQAGVQIQQFDGGLLHTKSITVDGSITMFGTVNLDMRSLWLNYEVTLFVYDKIWGNTIRDLQLSYLEQCQPVDRLQWSERSPLVRFMENLANLMSPLL